MKIGAYSFVADTKELITDGVIGKEQWQVGFYDALMIAAANKAGCSTMYTEDLNDGQKYGSVVARNPFKQKTVRLMIDDGMGERIGVQQEE